MNRLASPAARLPLVLALIAAVGVAALWGWLGRPVAMPPSPLPVGQKLPCVSYAPFRDGQSPFDKGFVVPQAQIDEDFAQLAKVAACVRTYSIEKGLEKAPELARKHGLTMYLGIWIGPEAERNREEVDTAIRLAKAYPDVVKAVVVGNEVLLRGEQSAIAMSAFLKEVKAAVAPIPVTYADVWEFWERNQGLSADVDFVTIHILPYWEDQPVSAKEAAAHVEQIRRDMAEAFPGKEILIGETGWPSAGRMREGALPSPSNQALVMHELLDLARREGYRVNMIEAFDQPWKRRSEGTVGGHWGIIDSSDREPKFHWGVPVQNHPNWLLHAIVGIAVVAGAFGAALYGAKGREDKVPPRDWLAVTAVAFAGGATLGPALSALPLESLGLVGWTQNLLFLLATLACVLGVPAFIGRGQGLSALATVLDGARRAAASPWSVAAGLVLAAGLLAVGVSAFGLVFNPRYKDFPIYPFTGIAVALAVLAALRLPERTGAGLAEDVAFWAFLAAGLYVPLNETLANWQALWFGMVCLALAFTLWRVRAAQRTR